VQLHPFRWFDLRLDFSPLWLSIAINVVLVVALFAVRRTLVVHGGVAKVGYGFVVPWWWSTLTTRGTGEVSLVSRTVSSGQRSRRTVVDLSLDGPHRSVRVWRTALTK